MTTLARLNELYEQLLYVGFDKPKTRESFRIALEHAWPRIAKVLAMVGEWDGAFDNLQITPTEDRLKAAWAEFEGGNKNAPSSHDDEA